MEQVSPEILRWVERAAGRDARVIRYEILKAKQTQPTWLIHLERTRAVLKISPLSWDGGVRGEAATLRLLETLGITAPRLVGVDLDGATGFLLLLETYLPNRGPGSTSPFARMRALGGAAAQLHLTALPVVHDLPRIGRPVWHDNYIADRRSRNTPTTPLLQEAEQRLEGIQQPAGHEVFVHGDFHHGNALWDDESVVALIDWDGSGLGNPGIDLGWARLEAALAYSPGAADEITYGWVDVTGHEPANLAYWDLVAALQSHADIGDRTEGRDQFLRAAMKRLDKG